MGKQFVWIAILAVLVGGSAFIDYRGYRSFREMRSDLKGLQQQVNDASKLAQQESVAAAAAGERAEAAARRAEVAAQGRQQAEQQQRQAESQREQAVATAQRSNQQAAEAQDQMRQMRQEREEELSRMQEALDRVVETHRTPNGMIIVLPNSIFRFEFDSSELNQHNRELLSRIAGILLVSKGYGLSILQRVLTRVP